MRLFLDLGNSLIKWGVRREGRWLAQGMVSHGVVDEIAGVIEQFKPGHCYGVNVAGVALGDAVNGLLQSRGLVPRWMRSERACCGVVNGYDQSGQLGADRWAALIGARGLFPGALLVVCAGTATTVDALTEDGRFLGGLILPGETLMRRALAGNTAQLPFAEGRIVSYPSNTADAIASGCRLAQAGAVEHLYARHGFQSPVTCVLSGGGAEGLSAALSIPVQRVDNLVLEGLARVAESGVFDG